MQIWLQLSHGDGECLALITPPQRLNYQQAVQNDANHGCVGRVGQHLRRNSVQRLHSVIELACHEQPPQKAAFLQRLQFCPRHLRVRQEVREGVAVEGAAQGKLALRSLSPSGSCICRAFGLPGVLASAVRVVSGSTMPRRRRRKAVAI
jgi:hypothetical protein